MADIFVMESQEQSEWCWAAVSVSVDHYFSTASNSTQCRVARDVLGLAGCCSNPDPCNEPARLQDALESVNCLAASPTGPLSFAEVRQVIDASKPVCLRIGWDGGGGHFLALCGYRLSSSGIPLVDVEDPLYG